jgi:hypothetical protein
MPAKTFTKIRKCLTFPEGLNKTSKIVNSIEIKQDIKFSQVYAKTFRENGHLLSDLSESCVKTETSVKFRQFDEFSIMEEKNIFVSILGLQRNTL